MSKELLSKSVSCFAFIASHKREKEKLPSRVYPQAEIPRSALG